MFLVRLDPGSYRPRARTRMSFVHPKNWAKISCVVQEIWKMKIDLKWTKMENGAFPACFQFTPNIARSFSFAVPIHGHQQFRRSSTGEHREDPPATGLVNLDLWRLKGLQCYTRVLPCLTMPYLATWCNVHGRDSVTWGAHGRWPQLFQHEVELVRLTAWIPLWKFPCLVLSRTVPKWVLILLILRPGADLQNQSEHIRTHCQAMSKTGVHIFGDLERYFEHLWTSFKASGNAKDVHKVAPGQT